MLHLDRSNYAPCAVHFIYYRGALNFETMLKNLEGISAEKIDADFIRTGKEIKPILNKGIAATAAGDSGAINIWKDDDGHIRCEAMRWMRSVDKKIFNNITEAEKWADKWLPDIGVFPYKVESLSKRIKAKLVLVQNTSEPEKTLYGIMIKGLRRPIIGYDKDGIITRTDKNEVQEMVKLFNQKFSANPDIEKNLRFNKTINAVRL